VVFLSGPPQARRADCRHMITPNNGFGSFTEFQRTGSMVECIEKSGMDRTTARKYLKHPERLGKPRPGTGLAHAGGSTGRDLGRRRTASARGSGAGSQGVVRAFADDSSEQAAGDAVADVSTAGRQWKLEHGPAPEVIFPQTHSPGGVMPLDWTHAKNWRSALPGTRWTICSARQCCPIRTAVGRRGVSRSRCCRCGRVCRPALFRLGKVPKLLQIDKQQRGHASNQRRGKTGFQSGVPCRWFAHYGLTAATIHVDVPMRTRCRGAQRPFETAAGAASLCAGIGLRQ